MTDAAQEGGAKTEGVKIVASHEADITATACHTDFTNVVNQEMTTGPNLEGTDQTLDTGEMTKIKPAPDQMRGIGRSHGEEIIENTRAVTEMTIKIRVTM